MYIPIPSISSTSLILNILFLKNQLIIWRTVNTQYIDLHLCVVDYYLCNYLNWYNHILIWVVTNVID